MITKPIDLGDGYLAVPYEAVTLNGMFLNQLLELRQLGDIAVIGPDGRALQSESGSTYRYRSLDEARTDVETLKGLK